MSKWRVGSKVPLNVYDDSRPKDAAHFFGLVCTCHTVEDAAKIVAAINEVVELRSPTYCKNCGHVTITPRGDGMIWYVKNICFGLAGAASIIYATYALVALVTR